LHRPLLAFVTSRPARAFDPGRARRDSRTSHPQSAIPKVLDFGLARITDADLTLTSVTSDTGKHKGTLAYMSPEQARGDAQQIDMRVSPR
jgi:serine/threonine protein kinase